MFAVNSAFTCENLMTSGQRPGWESSPALITNDWKITGLANPSTIGRPYVVQSSKTIKEEKITDQK